MNKIFYSYLLAIFCMLSACTTQQKIAKISSRLLIKDPILQEAHIGICIQDAEGLKKQYSHQSNKLFTPASNMKIISCFAAMKYLPSILPAAIITDIDTAVIITPTGDPSFLHPDFQTHPLFEKLTSINKPIYFTDKHWNSNALGLGWSWDDYNDYYMAERSAFPIYGNLITWYQEKTKKENPTYTGDSIDLFVYSIPELSWPVNFGKPSVNFHVKREMHSNAFTLYEGNQASASRAVPFITNGIETAMALLKDSLHKDILLAEENTLRNAKGRKSETVYSQPTDSLLKKMMYRSDNFYADQLLQMISQLTLEKMDEAAIINDILSKELPDISPSSRWVDGSGLSRYNQFTPEDMVLVLNKLKSDFSWGRVTGIFPTVGERTNSHLSQEPFIFAKSGSMLGIYCLSGYVFTKKKKWMTFSIMINNHGSSASVVRGKVVEFLKAL